MRIKLDTVAVGVLLTALTTVIMIIGCGKAVEVGPPKQVDSTQLTNTIVTSNMEEPITTGKNVIYCSTFQLAWNELKNDIIKEDIAMQNEPPMVKMLNRGLATKADISENAYVAMAGFGKDGIIDKINKALQSKFQKDAPVVSEKLDPTDIMAYAYLFKNLRFEEKFEKLEPIAFNGKTKVESFGIKEGKEKLSKQVIILDDKGPNDFIIKLVSDSPDDEIILAKIKPEATISETIGVINAHIRNGKSTPIGSHTYLAIPKLSLDIKHSYNELLEKNFTNKGFHSAFIVEAIQNIIFLLNEEGVILKSEAKIIVGHSESEAFAFDQPFMLYLKEKNGQYPYFAMWVDNPELMIKAK